MAHVVMAPVVMVYRYGGGWTTPNIVMAYVGMAHVRMVVDGHPRNIVMADVVLTPKHSYGRCSFGAKHSYGRCSFGATTNIVMVHGGMVYAAMAVDGHSPT